MSWCRWSTDLPNGTTSDLYVYDDMYGGVTVHIAGRKRVGIEDAPKELDWSTCTSEEWLAQNEKVRAWYDWHNEHGEWVPVNPEFAGKTYNFTDMDELIAFFDKCKSGGLNFPEYVYDYARESLPLIEGEKHE